MHESGVPVRQRDRDSGRHDGSLPWCEVDVDRGHEVGPCVAGMGVAGQRQIRVEPAHQHLQRHATVHVKGVRRGFNRPDSRHCIDMSKTVVVTGANSGIGLATALELATAGYDVIGTARSDEKAATIESAAAERGVEIKTVQLDVADSESTKLAFEEIADLTGGGPWGLVNNAGFAQAGAIEDVDDEAVRAQLEVNLVAPARTARLVLPHMRRRGEGRIINVSSIAGRMSLPLLGWYCASKH